MSKNKKPTKYQRWYDDLCYKARDQNLPSTAYTEVHHIKPRSLGGSDDPLNLVRLTYKQHFTAHRLLAKFHTGRNLQKMLKALWAMTLKASGERTPTAKQFEIAKKALRDSELENDDAARHERFRLKRETEIALSVAACQEFTRKSRIRELEEVILTFPDFYSSDEIATFKAELASVRAENATIPSTGWVIFKNGLYQTTTSEKDRRMYPKWHPPIKPLGRLRKASGQ